MCSFLRRGESVRPHEVGVPTVFVLELERFDFVPNFITWIKQLYQHPTASILSNSQRSRPFNLKRGTPQGYPLSPLLFHLARELLTIALHGCVEFSGIHRELKCLSLWTICCS